MKIFKKELMLKRLKKEGLINQVDEEIKKILDNLDGQKVDTQCWNRVVYNEPVYWCVGKDGKGQYVNENDCVEE